MSAAILDRARAFDLIAAHLPADRREAVAEAFAAKLLSEIGGKATPPAASARRPEPAPVIDLSEHTQVASFLVDHGYTGAALVQATGRATTFIAQHKNMTRDAALAVFVARERSAG